MKLIYVRLLKTVQIVEGSGTKDRHLVYTHEGIDEEGVLYDHVQIATREIAEFDAVAPNAMLGPGLYRRIFRPYCWWKRGAVPTLDRNEFHEKKIKDGFVPPPVKP